jgi:malonyl-CoA/methylmalonyl-CoA synthetase
MQLIDLFAASLIGQRTDVALEVDAPDGSVEAHTFGDLDDASNRLAEVLVAHGLTRGDRLVVILPNGRAFIEILLASLKLGIILVPVNVLYRKREVGHIVHDAAPSLVVALASAHGLLPPGTALVTPEELTAQAAAHAPTAVRRPLDGASPAAIVYTSGTTGRSKGAVLTHDNFLVNAASLVTTWRITKDDRYLAALPLFHVHGLGNGVMSWLAAGCRMRLLERFDASRAPAVFGDFRPTLIFGVPTIYVRLLELPPHVCRAIGGHARLFVCGSAPLPAHVLEAFRERFGHTILERYGMTETLMNMGNPYGGERRPGSVGLPFPGVGARIVDHEGRDVPPGTVGDLLVRGPNVFPGYWRDEEATARAFRDGWFLTGDLAEQSPDGYYALRGRRMDLIISGGFNIYPREIEEVLLEVPGVREAAVVGVPDERRGEVPVAYLVVETTEAAAAADATCRRLLASFKVPRACVLVDTLPRNALGKVQKHLLPPPPSRP